MNIEKPKISVTMPVYNAGKFLVAAIESILNQTYSNFELVIVDDASTDNSWEILSEYARRNKKIKLLRNIKHCGIPKTIKKAISQSKANFIARMDADDITPLNRFEKQIKYLIKHPNTIVLGGQVDLINENGIFIAHKQFPKKHGEIIDMAFTAMPLQQGTMMVNKKLLPKNFVWYKNNLETSEDLDFLFRASKYGRLANLGDVCLYYRQHGQSLTQVENPKRIFYQAYEVRQLAMNNYNIYPKLTTLIILYVQYILITLLPASLIYPIYYIWRGIHPLKSNKNGYNALFRHAFSYVL
jgi:glycosyltransferase involved in cell wall biosynthesis